MIWLGEAPTIVAAWIKMAKVPPKPTIAAMKPALICDRRNAFSPGLAVTIAMIGLAYRHPNRVIFPNFLLVYNAFVGLLI